VDCNATAAGARRVDWLCAKHAGADVFTCTIESEDKKVLPRKRKKQIAASSTSDVSTAVNKECKCDVIIEVFDEETSEFLDFTSLDILAEQRDVVRLRVSRKHAGHESPTSGNTHSTLGIGRNRRGVALVLHSEKSVEKHQQFERYEHLRQAAIFVHKADGSVIDLHVVYAGNVSTIKHAISMASGIEEEKQTLYLDRSAEKLTNSDSIGQLIDKYEIEGRLNMQLIVDSATHCSLQTEREANIGHRGFMFDLHAKTTIELHALTVHVQDTDDESLEYVVYVCPTSGFASNTRNPSAWTLASKGRVAPPPQAEMDGGAPLRRHASIALVRDIELDQPVQMSPGDTCGIYLHVASQRSGVVFHRGDTSAVANEHIEVEQGISTKSEHAFENPGSNPYAFAGTVHYSAMCM
jgi:hypothetical protein